MYILQESLFSFYELLEMELKDRLTLFLSSVDLGPYARKLAKKSPQGAGGYCREAIMRALSVAALEGISSFTVLVRRLESDIRFRYLCGLGLGKPPSVSPFSRVFKHHLKNYEAARAQGAQAIIPLNPRNEKEPPAGMLSDDTPCCSMGYPMVYWGAQGNALKFRCPHVLGKVDCPMGSRWCSSSDNGRASQLPN